ncbi:hypothetical protein TB2_019491 [Malus domestica]
MKIEKEEGRGRERVHVDARISREAGHQQQQQTTTEGEHSITTPPQVLRTEQQVVEPDIERLNEMRERLKKLNKFSSFLNIASLRPSPTEGCPGLAGWLERASPLALWLFQILLAPQALWPSPLLETVFELFSALWTLRLEMT